MKSAAIGVLAAPRFVELADQLSAQLKTAERRLSEARQALTDSAPRESDYAEGCDVGLIETRITECVMITRALERLHQGRYGWCDHCGHEIAIARLKALPFATACKPCQETLESKRRLRAKGDRSRDLRVLSHFADALEQPPLDPHADSN
jgi:RNA polymerase-binding transcription factor DksA